MAHPAELFVLLWVANEAMRPLPEAHWMTPALVFGRSGLLPTCRRRALSEDLFAILVQTPPVPLPVEEKGIFQKIWEMAETSAGCVQMIQTWDGGFEGSEARRRLVEVDVLCDCRAKATGMAPFPLAGCWNIVFRSRNDFPLRAMLKGIPPKLGNILGHPESRSGTWVVDSSWGYAGSEMDRLRS